MADATGWSVLRADAYEEFAGPIAGVSESDTSPRRLFGGGNCHWAPWQVKFDHSLLGVSGVRFDFVGLRPVRALTP